MKQFSSEQSNTLTRLNDSKYKELEMDKIIFGKIKKKNGSLTSIKNKLTGINEYLDKPMADLIRFGDSVSTMSLELINGYRDALKTNYTKYMKIANLDDEPVLFKMPKIKVLNSNNHNLNSINYVTKKRCNSFLRNLGQRNDK